MTPDEARAAGALVGRAVAGTARSVELTHEAVSAFALRRIGLGPFAPALGTIRRGVYATVRLAGPLVATVAGHAAAARIDPSGPPISATVRGSRVQAALNGAVGDALHAMESPFAVGMSLRLNGRDVRCEPDDLAVAYPEPSGTVVVFLHGLCHDENAWTPPADEHSGAQRPRYGERLALDTGATSLYVRYNSGRHVSENGTDLCDLLTRLHQAWPVPITRLVLVGHSMGGLVIRSACSRARLTEAAWLDDTGLIVTLGTPHAGAPLEQFAAATARGLDRTELTRGIARVFHTRSSGIKDLGDGYLHEPALGTADHLVVAATVTADPQHPIGRALGDLLVRTGSAHGGDRHDPHVDFPDDSRRLIPGVSHIGLLHDERVYEELRAALTPTASTPRPDADARQ